MIKLLNGKEFVPRELLELHDYFRNYKEINFKYEKEDGFIVAKSTNFEHGSIITYGKNKKELDENIKDAILTSFEIPSSYAKEAKIVNMKEKNLMSSLSQLPGEIKRN
ncbi:MAG: hypothetical protein GF347_03960 [Candidatus Moranbacteria bacterium]|nr:hypothetical protein [Candidatus Moranbacteria bacterium]